MVVKAIVIGLCFASLLTWTLSIIHFMEMIQRRTRLRRPRSYDELLLRWQRRGRLGRISQYNNLEGTPGELMTTRHRSPKFGGAESASTER
ncbi:hypothetical protein ACF1BQ_020815 [Bradyrhizobium sp. RDT10]